MIRRNTSSIGVFFSIVVVSRLAEEWRGRQAFGLSMSEGQPLCPGRQLAQGAAVDLPLEGHHLSQGIPVADPSPAIEFRLAGHVHADPALLTAYPQQEPLLFLADAYRPRMRTNHASRQAVAQPAPGAGKDLDVVGGQADLLVQLTK